jgi:hypothetical protein
MTATVAALPCAVPSPNRTLLALTRADALRFARHPIFLVGAAATLAALVDGVVRQDNTGVGVEGTILPAFFLGVFGFMAAHRLTTALRRSGDLPGTAPVGAQQRTLSMCLACLVPMTYALVLTLANVYCAHLWPTVLPGGHVAWFGYEPDLTIWAILIGDVVLAALGGPLLGVCFARWAPFRGSALVGVALLLFTAMLLSEVPSPYHLLSPWAIFWDEHLVNGEYETSWVMEGVSPAWWCGYAACLCGLAVVAALLRDREHRGRLLVTGGVLSAVGAACVVLAMA